LTPNALASWIAVMPMPLKEHLAGPQMNAVEDVGPHRAERLHQPAGIDEAHPLGHRQALYRRHRRVFVITVRDQQRTDLVADRPAAHPLANFHHRARAFEPGDVARSRRHRVTSHALQRVGAINPGSGDPDQHLACFRLGHRPGAGHQHLRPAGLSDLDHGLGRGNIGEHGLASYRLHSSLRA
jgi:hypothetical protein